MTFKPDDKIEFWRTGEWTVVYLNGKLVRAGDSYLADEWLQEYVGVTWVEDEGGVSVPDGRNALPTLAEARAALDSREKHKQCAAELREQAAKLREQAAKLLGEARRAERGL